MEDGKPVNEGWGCPSQSKKYHYFYDTEALCRRWGFFRGMLEKGQDDHKQNCAECKRRKAKRDAPSVKAKT